MLSLHGRRFGLPSACRRWSVARPSIRSKTFSSRNRGSVVLTALRDLLAFFDRNPSRRKQPARTATLCRPR